MEEIRRDLAGFGKRLNEMKIEQTKHGERIEINKENVNDLWRIVNEIREEIKALNSSVSKASLDMTTKINSAVLWVIGTGVVVIVGIGVPVFLLLAKTPTT